MKKVLKAASHCYNFHSPEGVSVIWPEKVILPFSKIYLANTLGI